MKNKLKVLLKKIRTLRRNTYELFGISKYSMPALNDLDEKLAKYLNFNNGFFIEVGGNDGYSQSNTYYLEKFLGWKGILVEGIPELYNQCKKERKKSSVYNCALVSNDFPDSYVEMHYAGLMSVVENSLKSSEKQQDHLESGLKIQKIDKAYTVKVPTSTLESILDDLPNLPPINFFSLDVEGYELDVLKGMNIIKYQPQYILIESGNLDEIQSFLSPYYEMIDKLSYHDYLYKLKS
jgi:FkbM family methyltransferase